MFFEKMIFFNGSSLSGDHTMDFEIKIERPSAFVESKFTLTVFCK